MTARAVSVLPGAVHKAQGTFTEQLLCARPWARPWGHIAHYFTGFVSASGNSPARADGGRVRDTCFCKHLDVMESRWTNSAANLLCDFRRVP